MHQAALCVVLAVGWILQPIPGHAEDKVVWGCDDAGYTGETREYRHGVLGDDIEYKTLVMRLDTGVGKITASLDLPDGQVFEDIAPRCGDLDGDGLAEVVTVVSDPIGGARLAVYSPRTGPLAQTPPIGQGNRWLAPIGIGDLDGDGQNDVAYVDRPHLAGVLRVWTLREGQLAEIANKSRFSNHRIGQDFITGGVRDCGDGAALVLPNFDWSALMLVRLREGELLAERIGSEITEDAIARSLECN
ncbi:MAG: FG-GAP repeat domain-containing protein [Paracoccaceae bacterium]